MKWFIRGLALSFTLGLMLVTAGCSASNEEEAGIKGEPPAQPKTYAEYGAASKGSQSEAKTSGYPGVK